MKKSFRSNGFSPSLTTTLVLFGPCVRLQETNIHESCNMCRSQTVLQYNTRKKYTGYTVARVTFRRDVPFNYCITSGSCSFLTVSEGIVWDSRQAFWNMQDYKVILEESDIYPNSPGRCVSFGICKNISRVSSSMPRVVIPEVCLNSSDGDGLEF